MYIDIQVTVDCLDPMFTIRSRVPAMQRIILEQGNW